MKILNALILVALLVVGNGCRSYAPPTVARTTTTTQYTSQTIDSQQNAPPAVVQQEPHASTIEQFTTNNVTYTIETIPNTMLTPTSREGDTTKRVYSSNIIAVHVRTNNVTENSTDATVPAPADNPQPENR